MRMGMLRQTKKPAMIALSFGFFTASSTRGPARRDSKLPTAFSRNPNDARMAMQLLSDNEPSCHTIAENGHPSKTMGDARIFYKGRLASQGQYRDHIAAALGAIFMLTGWRQLRQ